MPNRPNLSEKLRAAPLLCALVPMAAGIALGTLIVIPLYVWIVSAVVCAATAIVILSKIPEAQNRLPVRLAPTLYAGLAILFFGAALARAHLPQQIIPQGERVWMEIVLTDTPVAREGRRSASSYGTVLRWQPDSPDTPVPADEWLPARERLLVSIDTVWHFEAGDRVTFRGYVNPVSDTMDSYLRFPPSHPGHSSKLAGSRFGVGYSRLMRSRGYTGRTYISQYSSPEVAPAKAKTSGAWAKNLQSGATERLRRLAREAGGRDPLSDAIAVATAMTTGDRSGITPQLRRAYSRTGASHLLAVSGLHVGVVFLIINVLLYLLPLAPRGHIVKNLIAIAAIWFYAALTGLSPSATRAAFMFTGAQIALATSQARNPANIMSGTALVMLAVKPGLLFDISFQLSFIAVAAIMAWFPPLFRLIKSRFRLLNAIWTTLLVGLVASVATMPLVSHTFGVFSPAGIVLNPLVITTAHLTVGLSLLWIALPVPLLEPLFRRLVGGPAWLQNRVVELVADVPDAAVEWAMPLWLVFAVYTVITTLTVWYYARPHRQEPLILPR
jgi:competence protein ComEC